MGLKRFGSSVRAEERGAHAMHAEGSFRWTPRRVVGGIVRRLRAAKAATSRRVGAARERARLLLDSSTPESTAARLATRSLLRGSVLGAGPAVSLTSHGSRIDKVHLTIESIAQGTLRPSALHLWLDDPAVVQNPPAALRRLMRRGLSVGLSANYGPHTKYFPYLLIEPLPDGPLVTADDDILYPRTWLQGLAQANAGAPSIIHCYRARRVVLEGDGFAPYLRWPRSHSMAASPLNFLTGVSGVIYPPAFLRLVREQGDAFLQRCPRADDVWLHRCAVEFGFDVHQMLAAEEHEHFPIIPGSQEQSLMAANVVGGENDAQIAATYTHENIERLRAVAAELGEA